MKEPLADFLTKARPGVPSNEACAALFCLYLAAAESAGRWQQSSFSPGTAFLSEIKKFTSAISENGIFRQYYGGHAPMPAPIM